MRTFVGIDGLRRLLEVHPEFEWIRYEPNPLEFKAIVCRCGELFTGTCTNKEAAKKSIDSSVWRDRREQMTKITAIRRAIESAFPEFKQDRGL